MSVNHMEISGHSRRLFIWSGASLGLSPVLAQRKGENVYRFATPAWDIQMTVEFYDRYSTNGFWFDERRSNRKFCLSAEGREGRDCLGTFSGSLAVARYHIRPRPEAPNPMLLRERVRTIDQDDRLQARAPFDRAIEIREGIASDIQAFGREGDVSSAQDHTPERHAPWCLLRQDLSLDGQSVPFLVIHWKHALNGIRILDIIPGDGTQLISK
jgi:hypothetical protein